MKNIFFLLMTVLVLTSCSTPSTQLYSWKGYNDAVYAYTKDSDEKSIENLLEVYQRLINKPEGSREIPPPGVCADYGYLLLQSGKTEEGKTLLLKETALYPESKKFIDRIIKRLEK